MVASREDEPQVWDRYPIGVQQHRYTVVYSRLFRAVYLRRYISGGTSPRRCTYISAEIYRGVHLHGENAADAVAHLRGDVRRDIIGGTLPALCLRGDVPRHGLRGEDAAAHLRADDTTVHDGTGPQYRSAGPRSANLRYRLAGTMSVCGCTIGRSIAGGLGDAAADWIEEGGYGCCYLFLAVWLWHV